ncbi:hypothetical protein [Parasitella parasitica]|uniref:Zn(2)-C6 fungal-type domain-containing protein n=1 Tax=Parasitella parasitica TaxID=35722 RepID=A0A0B7NVW7_9FUNG|nr:hypothetical protein [Parasitella parasitica]
MQMYNSTELAEPKAAQLPVDKTRRKRLKVVSACSECRRKKTKCNGEKPCAGCIKTNMDCKYSNSPKSRPSSNRRPLVASSSPKPVPPLPSQSQHALQESRYYHPQSQQPSQLHTQSNDKSNTIQAIENRLNVIEDILQILLKQQRYQQQQQVQQPQIQQQQQHHHQYQYPIAHQYHQKSAFVPVEQRNMQVHHSGPYYGDYHHNDGGNNYRQMQSQKRKFNQVEQQTRLPPPHNYQPSLSESSSTSTTSSICSNPSPKMNTIQALLNTESDFPNAPPSKPSAFYRPAPTTIAASAGNVY